MNASFAFLRQGEPRTTSVLVLADFQQCEDSNTPSLVTALEKCRAAFAHARARKIPVALVHRSSTPDFANPSLMEWVRPSASDMVFNRFGTSCYTSSLFCDMADVTEEFTLVAMSASLTAVATAVDAARRRHALTLLSDASWSNRHASYSADEMHRAATTIVSAFGRVTTTHAWLTETA